MNGLYSFFYLSPKTTSCFVSNKILALNDV